MRKAVRFCIIAGLASLAVAIGASAGTAKTGAATATKPTIGFIVPVLANPYWALEVDYAKTAARDLGANILVGNANSQDTTLVNIIDGWISRKVSGIVVGLVDDAVTTKILSDAETAGIPITFMQREPAIPPNKYHGNSYVGFVGTSDLTHGEMTGKALYDAGVTKVVAITTPKGSETGIIRLQGLLNFAKTHPKMKVIQKYYGVELQSDAETAMENLLSAHPGPGFDGVWCVNDECALGVIQVLKHAGDLNKVKITAGDGIPQGIALVQSGEVISDPGGGYLDGGFALTMLYDYIQGHKPATRTVLLPYVNITKANSAAFTQTYIKGVNTFNFRKYSAVYTPGASTKKYALPPVK